MTLDTYEIVKNCGSKKEDMRIALNAVIDEYKPIFEDHSGKVRMVALDTSSTESGYAYFEAGDLKDSGIINHEKEKDPEIRVEDMVMSLYNILNTYIPDIVVIENNVVGRNAKTERMLGHIVGCINGWALSNFKEFVKIRPSEWRKAVKGDIVCPRKRDEAKKWSINRTAELYHIWVNDNEADAILLGTGYVRMMDALK